MDKSKDGIEHKKRVLDALVRMGFGDMKLEARDRVCSKQTKPGKQSKAAGVMNWHRCPRLCGLGLMMPGETECCYMRAGGEFRGRPLALHRAGLRMMAEARRPEIRRVIALVQRSTEQHRAKIRDFWLRAERDRRCGRLDPEQD